MCLALLFGVIPTAAQGQRQRVRITVDPRDSVRSFDPRSALGSTIDGHIAGATRRIFTAANVTAMKSAGFHTISYRLRTELGVEAWHWNPQGHWSDAAKQQGYWTSDDAIGAPIIVSNGYHLPRRGNSVDQANDDGYSRLTDGDTASFWKSNPYLDSHFTGEPVAAHPQWVIIDLASAKAVSAIRILWGIPFATRYDVQYWPGEQPRGPDDNADDATWRTFAAGAVDAGASGSGGDALVQLSARPVSTRWIRVLLRRASYRAPAGSRDIRDGMGFAIREISVGRMDHGIFRDLTRHARTVSRQTQTYASSTDPWHRATDRDEDTEQPGIDLLFTSGLTRGLPTLMPAGVLYDTPANAAAMLRYLRRRHYSVPRVELGEEPDGQFVAPDDFAALYIQIADSLRGVDPAVILGGPSLQDGRTKVMMAWKETAGDVQSWMGHFIDALSLRHHARDLAFVSFEFYPFDDVCGSTALQLASVSHKIDATVAQFRHDGVRRATPLLMTEYGYSAFATANEMDRAGAILNTQAVAQFLTAGGAETFFYGTEPSSMDRTARCNSWGDNTLLLADDDRRIRAPNATYRGARTLNTLWADSAGGTNTLLGTKVSADGSGVSAYALRRSNGRIALIIINRDPNTTWTATVSGVGSVAHELDMWRFSSAEYQWHANGARGYARPNMPPRKSSVTAGSQIELPPYSIVLLREP